MEWRWQSAVRLSVNQSVGESSAGLRAWLRLPEHSFFHSFHSFIFLYFTFVGSPGSGRFGGFARALLVALSGSAHLHKSSSGVSESSGRLPALCLALLRMRRSTPSARATVAATSATASAVTAAARPPESISS